MERTIKARAPKGREEWRSVSIPTSIYEKLLLLSSEKGESVSLIVRKCLSKLFSNS